MAINVVNATGESDIYLGFSNDPDFDITSTINYFVANLPTSTDQVFNMNPNDQWYSSGDYQYMMVARKSLSGGALFFKVQDLVDGYGKDLNVRITNQINSSTGVYDNFYTANPNSKYPTGIVPMGATAGQSTLYMTLPSFTITSNVAKSFDPSDYTKGDMIAGPVFAFADPNTTLAVITGVPYVISAKAGGMSMWMFILIIALVIFIILVLIVAGITLYKKNKPRGY